MAVKLSWKRVNFKNDTLIPASRPARQHRALQITNY